MTETHSVKRKRASLPSEMPHPPPTKGEWLSKRYVVNNYILLDLLGTGSYAEVRLCKEKTTDDLFAVKILNKSVMNKRKVGAGSTAMDDVKREIAIMKKLSHPHVLRLYEVMSCDAMGCHVRLRA